MIVYFDKNKVLATFWYIIITIPWLSYFGWELTRQFIVFALSSDFVYLLSVDVSSDVVTYMSTVVILIVSIPTLLGITFFPVLLASFLLARTLIGSNSTSQMAKGNRKVKKALKRLLILLNPAIFIACLCLEWNGNDVIFGVSLVIISFGISSLLFLQGLSSNKWVK